jgi:hypothetical protein
MFRVAHTPPRCWLRYLLLGFGRVEWSMLAKQVANSKPAGHSSMLLDIPKFNLSAWL